MPSSVAATMSGWTARTLDVPLSFLSTGGYEATLVSDGINADRYAADHRIESRLVESKDTLRIELAPGGGFVARLVPKGMVRH